MATYAIGDIQGCFASLQKLLQHVNFQQEKDTLWFTGDLVNRGPQSLQVLRFVKELGDKHVTVLGNHDLHLLSVAYGVREQHKSDTLNEILSAPDKNELIDWLRHRPLLHYDEATQFIMTHAGLAPSWSLQRARQLAHEVEAGLSEKSPEFLLKNMYGNQPGYWDDTLTGIERMRSIINYLTRMRFCYADGRLDLAYKGNIADKPQVLTPWFLVANRVNANEKIIFGHWAALGGEINIANVYALDTGCVWGNSLTAMRLEDEMRFSVRCSDC